MPSNVVSEASLGTRASQWWSSIPFITSGALFVCSAIYVVDLLFGYDSFQQVCFSPDSIVYDFQVYRIFSAVLFHASLMHVIFNMLALVPIGSSLERVMGSVRFLHLLLIVAVTNAMIHLVIAFIVAKNPVYPYSLLMRECQIGFSGLLFAMIVIESSFYTAPSRSIFGFFNVPAKWYPWVLLIIFQLLMPRVSLLGHLSGILSGFAYSYGLLNFLLLSQATYSKIESSWLCALCMRRPGFIVGGGSPAAGSLPSFSTPISTGRLGDAWRQLRSSVTPRTEDQRFPGPGRTLGGRTTATQAPDPNRDLEAHLLDDDDLELVESPAIATVGAGGPRLPTTTARPASTTNQVPEGDKEAALRSLKAMGFEESQANVALQASNWDITTAVEILSTTAQAH